MRSPFREEKLREIAEHAILIKDLDELREMARAMETIKECHFTSIADIDWTIGRLEKQGRVADSQSVDDAPEKLEKIRHARRFAATTAYCLPRSPNPCGTSGAIAALVPPDGATARDHEAAPGPRNDR